MQLVIKHHGPIAPHESEHRDRTHAVQIRALRAVIAQKLHGILITVHRIPDEQSRQQTTASRKQRIAQFVATAAGLFDGRISPGMAVRIIT